MRMYVYVCWAIALKIVSILGTIKNITLLFVPRTAWSTFKSNANFNGIQRVLELKGSLQSVYCFGLLALLPGAAIKWLIIKLNNDRIAFLSVNKIMNKISSFKIFSLNFFF